MRRRWSRPVSSVALKDGVRLINGGEFKAKKVTFKVDYASAGAVAAIEAAGGKVDLCRQSRPGIRFPRRL